MAYKLVAVLGSSLIAFALTEVGLRLMRSTVVGKNERHISSLTVERAIPGTREAYFSPDDYYGKCDCLAVMDDHPKLKVVPRRNVDGNGYHTNNVHCRYDDDLTAHKNPNEIRIVVTGGSTAWGAGVHQHETFSAVLERLLREKYPHIFVRIVCAGVGTYSSSQELGFADEFIASLKPDAIVMFTGWNDTYYGYRGEQQKDPRESLQRLDPPRYDDFVCKSHYVVARWLHQQRYAGQMKRLIEAGSAPPGAVVDLLQSNVVAMGEIAKRSNGTLICCLQPTLYETRKELTDWEKSLVEYYGNASLGISGYNASVYRAYRASFPEHALRYKYQFHDMDAAIQDEPQSVFVDHVHFGTRGNQLIAEALLPIVQQVIQPDTRAQLQNRVPALR